MPRLSKRNAVITLKILVAIGFMWTLTYPVTNNQLVEQIVNEVISFPSNLKEKIHDCLDRKLKGVSFVICVKNPQVDEFISKSIIKGGVWEAGIVKHEMLAMQKYPQALFLDLGSNIGVHSLPIAAMNRSVVAVDAIFGNLAFIDQSINTHKQKYPNKGSIRLLYNAVSDHHETLFPITLNERNEGGTNLLTKDQLEGGNYDKTKISAPPVESVTTLEILKFINAKQVIMKIDVEGFECQALPDEVLDQSSGISIPYIFMEWMVIRDNLAGRCPHPEELEKRLYKNGYVPKNADISNKRFSKDSKTWKDVAWVHQSQEN